MLDSIKDKRNREFDAANQYEAARQRIGQSVESFVAYLDSLETELGVTDDASQRRTLYSKLLPEIRDRITSYNDVPETREDLISLATRLEGSDAVNAKAARNDKRNREAHE